MILDNRLLAGLEVFGHVMRLGSFARTANVVRLTKSGVSKTIARLESRLGVKLLERTPDGLIPTSAGRALFDRTESILSELEIVIQDVTRDLEASPSLHVRIDLAISGDHFAKILCDFAALHPSLQIVTLVGDQSSAVQFDVAVQLGMPEVRSMRSRLLSRSRLIACATPSYLAQHRAPKTPDQLAADGHRCLLLIEGEAPAAESWQFEYGTRQATVPIVKSVAFNDPQLLRAAARQGAGIACLFELDVASDIRAGKLVRVLPDWSCEMPPAFVCLPPHAPWKPAVALFVDHLFSTGYSDR